MNILKRLVGIQTLLFFFWLFLVESITQLSESILNTMQRSVTPLVKPHNFMHPDDNLILEDESGRVKLGGSALSPAIYVTGIIWIV